MIVRRTIRCLAFLAVAAGFELGCSDASYNAATLPETDKPVEEACADTHAGTFHNRKLEVDGEERAYFLHVPTSYSCAKPAPLFVDFHGTSTGPRPEESYGQDELEALSEAKGFILVRPRSRSSDENGTTLYRWDQNDGDVERNVVFADALVHEIVKQYRVDPERMFVSGFSSGTNMAAMLLEDTSFRFSGFGMIGGGSWDDPGLSTFTTDAPRIYTLTGYRDYMYEYLLELDEMLAKAGFPAEKRMNREVNTGHDLYGWHYDEMWQWLDRGEAPPQGTVAAPWVVETIPSTESLLALATNPAGDVIATGSGGSFFKRDATSRVWSKVGHVADAASSHCTSLCFLPSGAGIAVGGTLVARTDDGGATWMRGADIPEFQRDSFGSSYLNGIMCSKNGRVYGGGYWTGVTSPDGGKTWLGAEMNNDGYLAQVAAIAGEAETVVSVGYYGYIGRSVGDGVFESMSHPGNSQWFTAVAAAKNGNFWVVGEAGEILHSGDDGKTWARQNTPQTADLYAVAFRDVSTGLAAGRAGTTFVTKDGGTTWVDASTGLDRYFGAALFVGPNEVLVAGERGTVLRTSL